MDDLMMPYFCYGTLRPGCGNAWLWQGCQAECRGDGLVTAPEYGLMVKGLPFAVPRRVLELARDEDVDPVRGALIFPSPDGNLASVLRRQLDELEGHPFGYFRTPTVVHYEGGERLAWIYVWPHLDDLFDDRYKIAYRGDFWNSERMVTRR
jgi:gamma-glutamylcyclotransferase (GGCT)/AIG2-like uncharacterized protein YtfP